MRRIMTTRSAHVALLLAVVAASGCFAEVVDESELEELEELEEVAVTEQAILNGSWVAGHRGVVLMYNSEGERCTGVLIDRRHMLTAAHCTDLPGTRSSTGVTHGGVWYFDPAGNPRWITFDEDFDTFAVGTWDGLNNANAVDRQDDLAIIRRRSDWGANTGHRTLGSQDFQRIWLGSIRTVDKNTLYGAGANHTNGSGGGMLRSMGIDINGSRTYYFWDIGRTRRTCTGDSGGPYLDWVNGTEVVLGIHVTSERDGGNACAENGGRQYGARLNSRRDWIAGIAGCSTSGSFMTCF